MSRSGRFPLRWAVLSLLSGCAGNPLVGNALSHKTFQVRVEVGTKDGYAPPGLQKKVLHWSKEAARYRWVQYGYRSSRFGLILAGPALVPDQIGVLEEGAIVKVITNDLTDIDLTAHKVSRVVELVCAAKDTACIQKAEAQYGWRAYAEFGPQVPSAETGLTYTPQAL